jgi:hypothetical protein
VTAPPGHLRPGDAWVMTLHLARPDRRSLTLLVP